MTNLLPSTTEENLIIRRMLTDRNFRLQLVRGSHYWFSHFYFREYITYPTADFQREMFKLTEAEDLSLVVLVAFRGSSKSTTFTMSYPIWAILGKQQKKFVIIVSQTQRQAQQHLMNLKHELERNRRLGLDLGPLREESDTWGRSSLVLPKYNAQITAVSIEQPIRGMRHNQFRPALIIADDIEDLESVKTKEGRDKTYGALQGDIIPAGGPGTKVVVVGNLLHADSVTMRLKQAIDEKRIDGVFKSYPLVDGSGKIAWTGKYPNMAAVETERRKFGSEAAFQREFNLKIIADEEQLIHPEWIKYYDDIPDLDSSDYRYAATGVDLAISQASSADYTSMISARVFGRRENLRIYILPNPVNERLDFPATLERVKMLSRSLGNGIPTKLFIESEGYQSSLVQQLADQSFPAEEFRTHGHDKRARLAIVTPLVQAGRVIFAKGDRKTNDLIQQLLGFGTEKHDDMSDAFAILLLKILESEGGGIVFPGQNGANDQPLSRKDAEHEADLAAMRESEYERSGFNPALRNRFGHSGKFTF